MSVYTVDASDNSRQMFSLKKEPMEAEEAATKVREINNSKKARAYLESNRLVVLELLVD